MTEFVLLIPLFGVLMVVSSTFRFQRVFNPVSIIVFWWCFWLWVANFGLTGFFVPGAKTQIMVLIMVGAVFLGSKLATGRTREAADVSRVNDRILRNGRSLFWLNVLAAPFVGFFFLRALPLLLSRDLVVYRSLAFSGMEEPDSVFGGGYPQFLFHLIVSPLVFFSLIAGLVLIFLKKKKKLLLASFILITLEAVMMMGRFNFYYILAFVLLISVFLAQRKSPSSDRPQTKASGPGAARRGKLKILAVAAALLAVLFVLSLFRGEKNAGLFVTLKKISIDYHTVGFVLFDQELRNPLSRLNTGLSYGRSSAGGIDTLVAILLRRFDNRLVPMAGESGKHFDEQRVVGEDPEGRSITANAFYTVLYSLYYDGRYLAVVFLPLLFGYLIASRYLDWLKNGGLDSLILLTLLMYLGIFSLFQSPLEGLKFWLALVFLVWMKTFSLAFLKVNREPPG